MSYLLCTRSIHNDDKKRYRRQPWKLCKATSTNKGPQALRNEYSYQSKVHAKRELGRAVATARRGRVEREKAKGDAQGTSKGGYVCSAALVKNYWIGSLHACRSGRERTVVEDEDGHEGGNSDDIEFFFAGSLGAELL